MTFNNDKSSVSITNLGHNFSCIKYHNRSDVLEKKIKEVARGTIQIHFSLKKSNKLIFNNGRYAIDVSENCALFLYNPNHELPINLDLAPNAKYLILLIDINKFHSFFSKESHLIQFLSDENVDKKYYTNKTLNPREIVVLNELFNFNLNPSLQTLYTKGKVYELLSIFFHKGDEYSVENCPFLKDESNVKKILKAKTIIIERMDDPPHLEELAALVQLPLKKLKVGFKEIYGSTVFKFLLNYKMELARNMIETNDYNISEISAQLGYSTPSHFISAFKAKYGTTPKKYMINTN